MSQESTADGGTTRLPTRPPLRYHGGKWRLAPWIISHFPPHRIYVEPFGGGASVLLRKPRSYAKVYNDLDGEVVNVFRVLREPESACRLAQLLYLTPFARDEFVAAYGRAEDPVDEARATIVRAHMGFGADSAHSNRRNRTGFRASSNRSNTTPAHDWRNFPHQVQVFCERLRAVVIENRDWREVIAQHDAPDVLFYVDPPYVRSTRSRTDHGYKHEFTDENHRELAVVLRSVAGAVVLSGYECDLYNDLYRGWHVEKRVALADGGSRRVECLWLSQPACQRRLFDLAKESA